MKYVRLKHLASITPGQSPANEDVSDSGEIPFLQGCAEFGQVVPRPTRYCSNPPRLATAGSWLISVRAPVGKLNLADQHYGIGRGLAAIATKTVNHSFLGYALHHSVPALATVATGSTYDAVSAGQIGNLLIPVPDLPAQKRIADFLDRETARIDQLIEKKQRLVASLEDRWISLVTTAVTNGFSHRPTKESGVEWLGKVPEHWNIAPLKYIAMARTGCAFSSDDFVADGVPVLRIGDITRDGRVDLASAVYLPWEFLRPYGRFVVQRNDIVMAMTGATVGKAGLFEEDGPALLNQRVCIVRPKARNEQRYIWYVLNTRFYAEYIALTAFGGAQPNISDTALLGCHVPIPPQDEQLAIAKQLDAMTAQTSSVLAKTQKSAALLHELRSALITAAVTGQIDPVA